MPCVVRDICKISTSIRLTKTEPDFIIIAQKVSNPKYYKTVMHLIYLKHNITVISYIA